MSYISLITVVVAPVARKKLFLLYKTCEIQTFRPQIIIVLNFNQKTLQDKKCQVLCVLHSFYPSTSSTTVSVPIDTSSVVTPVQIFRLQIIMPDLEVEPRIHTTKSSIFCFFLSKCVLLLCCSYIKSRRGQKHLRN